MASQCGTPALARALNRILVDHIRAVLPSLRTKLEEALGKRTAELGMYGSAPPGSTSAQRCVELGSLDALYACVVPIAACGCVHAARGSLQRRSELMAATYYCIPLTSQAQHLQPAS